MRPLAPSLSLLLAILLSPGCGGGEAAGPIEYDGPLTVPWHGTGNPGGDGSDDGGGGSPIQEWRDLWTSNGAADYRITVQRLAYTLPEFSLAAVVEVRGGRVVSRTYESSGLPVNALYKEWWPDVEGMFTIVEDAMARGAARVDVTFDAIDRHPVRIDIDEDTGLADDEQTLTTWNLVRL